MSNITISKPGLTEPPFSRVGYSLPGGEEGGGGGMFTTPGLEMEQKR